MNKPNIYFDMQRLAGATTLVDQAVYAGAHPNGLLAVATGTDTVLTHIAAKEDTVAPDSIFLLASITKPMVATAIMQLVESGKLLLDQPIVATIPEFGA